MQFIAVLLLLLLLICWRVLMSSYDCDGWQLVPCELRQRRCVWVAMVVMVGSRYCVNYASAGVYE